jgi:hypothetical protein
MADFFLVGSEEHAHAAVVQSCTPVVLSWTQLSNAVHVQVGIELPGNVVHMLDMGQLLRVHILLPRISSPTCTGSSILAGALQSCCSHDARLLLKDVLRPLLEGAAALSAEQERLVMHLLQSGELSAHQFCNDLAQAICQVITCALHPSSPANLLLVS